MSFDRLLLEFLGKQLECCCAMTILGNMKTVGSNIKYNPGKQESTGSKNIYMQFVNESCQGSSGDTAPFRVFTRRSKTAAKQ